MTVVSFIDLLPKLVTNTAPMDEVVEWDSSTTYSVGDEARFDNKIWKSAKDNNTGNEPSPETLDWIFDRPVNELAMFDDFPITRTKSTDEIVLEFENIKKYSNISFGNIYCKDIRIEITNPIDGTVLHDDTIGMVTIEDSIDWYTFFTDYGELEAQNEYIYTVTKTEISVNIKITITPYLGKVEVGLIGMGDSMKLGCTLREAQYSSTPDIRIVILNNTKKAIGGTNWSEISYKIYVPIEQLSNIKNRLIKLNGKSVLFKGDDDGELLIYSSLGFFTGFEIDIPNGVISWRTYSIDGSI